MGTLEWKGGRHDAETKAERKLVGKTRLELSRQLLGLGTCAEGMLQADVWI